MLDQGLLAPKLAELGDSHFDANYKGNSPVSFYVMNVVPESLARRKP